MVLFEKPKSRQEIIADDPLGEFFVWWLDVPKKDVDALEQCLRQARAERDIQLFLERKPNSVDSTSGRGPWSLGDSSAEAWCRIRN
jgi:hypothetical protein